MSSAATPSVIIRALNSTVAAALTRTIVLGLPVLGCAVLWGADRYFNDRVAVAPVVVELQADRSTVHTMLSAQSERLRELEESRRTTALLIASQSDAAARQSSKIDRIDSQLNRMVGAFEARGLIPRQTLAPSE